MKAAILYYSMLGNSELVAGKIAERLGADIIRIEPDKAYPDKGARKFLWGGKSAVMGEMPRLKPYEFDPDKYDLIILGFPVWASRPAPPIRTFVEEFKGSLKGKKLAVFACQSGNGAEKAFAKLKEQIGIDNFVAELILIDPKTKEISSNDDKINSFCEKTKS
ncbi:MAG: flavodoxin [Lachnospiraceae bacterium]|nr:flavodoxin [Lachnospiraceae bacterium]